MATKRQMIQVASPTGPEPLASGARVGDVLYSSTIVGRDPSTGRLDDGPELQFQHAFTNAERLVRAAGLTPSDIGQVTIFINDASYRPQINKPWLELFPEDAHRPSRKTTHAPMPDGTFVQLQVIAAAGGSRRPLEIHGLSHRDPLPMGARLGDLVFSSVIGGDDPSSGSRPEGQPQIDIAFDNMVRLVEDAGGTVGDVLLVWVYLGDFAFQAGMVETWLRIFPEEGNRPARKTFPYDLGGRTTLIQLQFLATLRGKRENYEIEGIGHHDPIPLGASKGGLFYSSGIDGRDPKTGKLASGPEAQTRQALENTRTLVESAGGALGGVVHLTFMLGDLAYQDDVLRAWKAVFPDEHDRPALHMMNLGIPGRENLIQAHVAAVL